MPRDSLGAHYNADAVPDPTPHIHRDALHALRGWFAAFESAAVALSGGVDSGLLAKVARDALGDRAVAVIGVSPSLPRREAEAAVRLAESVGIRHVLVEPGEHRDPRYAANPVNRCYFCKEALYGLLAARARTEDWAVVVDGTNSSDLDDDRPGRAAAAEAGVRSPLVELNIDKAMVRELARALQLPVWDKPAAACLASRVPHGTAVTVELLRQIEAAEDVLHALGFRDVRVRHHGDTARIELPPDDMPAAVDHHATIVRGLRAAGYRHVTLDLAGRGGAERAQTEELVQLTTMQSPGGAGGDGSAE